MNSSELSKDSLLYSTIKSVRKLRFLNMVSDYGASSIYLFNNIIFVMTNSLARYNEIIQLSMESAELKALVTSVETCTVTTLIIHILEISLGICSLFPIAPVKVNLILCRL